LPYQPARTTRPPTCAASGHRGISIDQEVRRPLAYLTAVSILIEWEHTFVSIKGGSYARFRRALDSGNLTRVRAAAAELPSVNLEDALRICVLLRDAHASGYERAVIRWLGRLCRAAAPYLGGTETGSGRMRAATSRS
jgi:hypothetical protein